MPALGEKSGQKVPSAHMMPRSLIRKEHFRSAAREYTHQLQNEYRGKLGMQGKIISKDRKKGEKVRNIENVKQIESTQ